MSFKESLKDIAKRLLDITFGWLINWIKSIIDKMRG